MKNDERNLALRSTTEDLEENFEVRDHLVAAAAYRQYIKYEEKCSNGNEKDNADNDDLFYLYNRLSTENQRAINNLIRRLLGKNKKDKHNPREYFNKIMERNFGENLKKILEYRGLTYFQVASITLNMQDYENRFIDKKELPDEYLIASYLRAFLKSEKPQDKSINLIDDICRVLSIDSDLLWYGKGNLYSINWEAITDIANEKNLSPNDIFKKTTTKLIYELGTSKKYDIFEQNIYCEGICEAFADALGVEYDDILNKERFVLEYDELPFEKYYNKLDKDMREIVKMLIIDLHDTEIDV